MLRIKKGVSIFGLKPEILLGITIAASVFSDNDLDCWLVSVVEGKHGRGSLHFVGLAFDLRIRHIGGAVTTSWIVKSLKIALGKEFDVVLEDDHIHIEYQPKVGVNQK